MKYLDEYKIVELDNNRNYIVINSIIYDDDNYVYLVSDKDPKDQEIALVTKEDNRTKVNIIDKNAEENKELLAEIMVEITEGLTKYLNKEGAV